MDKELVLLVNTKLLGSVQELSCLIDQQLPKIVIDINEHQLKTFVDMGQNSGYNINIFNFAELAKESGE